ncbi:MAG: FAD-dependent thymidylate synthase [Alphaproteobacteria bacterium]|nr:FAD-dependent thymidylate synthase [Alphaproteobacteria bacterium]
MSDIIRVKQIAETNVGPTVLASHAARTCYSADVPKLGDTIDVKNRLFKTGHHSTLEHNYFTFNIDGIPVSSCVFGLHLTAPFYDTDQRSGRFSKMYDNPDMDEIRNMLETYYPYDKAADIHNVCDFVEMGLDTYAKNIGRVTETARDAIHRERPRASEKYVESNAPKFAQEQLRMFVSMIAPTALDYTIDLASLTSFYRTAWNPFMWDVVAKMAAIVTSPVNNPDIAYMFDTYARPWVNDWSPQFAKEYRGIKKKPEFKLLDYKYSDKWFVENKALDTVDTLQFDPHYMNNSLMYVDSKIHVDAGATMGQDQRHRSIQRSQPYFTGYFYLPPLLVKAGLKKDADKFMKSYYALRDNDDISRSMLLSVAPYGAMVEYSKHANLNALMHEQGKRTCWCAQEAIYHISCDLRRDLGQCIGTNAKLMKYLTPPCLSMGKCPEGPRCCGRDIVADKINGYFKQRQI